MARATAGRTARRWHLLQQREILDELEDGEVGVVAERLRQVAEAAAQVAALAVVRGVIAEQAQRAAGWAG